MYNVSDEEISLIVAVIVAALWYGISSLHKHAKKRAEALVPVRNKDDDVSLPDLKPFRNAVTFTILMVCNALILLGLFIIVETQSFWGVVVAGIGVLIWWAGDTEHSVDPPEAGVLTLWDTPLCGLDGKPIVVGGRTILLPWFPFYLTSVRIDMTNQDFDFEMVIYAMDGPMEGKVSLTLRPDECWLLVYIAAGKMENIIKEIDEIVTTEVREIASHYKSEMLAKNPSLISKPLERKLDTVFERKFFGIRILKIRAPFKMDGDLMKAWKDHQIEKYQRKNEEYEYDTDFDAAIKLRNHYRAHGTDMPLEKCLNEIKTLRLIRDEKIIRVEGNDVTLIDTKIAVGGKK